MDQLDPSTPSAADVLYPWAVGIKGHPKESLDVFFVSASSLLAQVVHELHVPHAKLY